MKFYVAHLIMSVRLVNGSQVEYPIWENMKLLVANSREEAQAEAERIGKNEEEPLSESFRYGGEPGRIMFEGVRKLIECESSDERPGHGTEISYAQYQINDLDQLRPLAGGDEVSILYVE